MIGIGVDICSISRIESAINKNKSFLDKCYNIKEIEYLNSRGKFFMDSAAAMFAAKEATIKALKSGIAIIPLSSIIILHEQNGAPFIKLEGKALDVFNNCNAKEIHLSISHEKDMAIAFVIVE